MPVYVSTWPWTELQGHGELTRTVKVLRDGLRQFAGASQRGGAGRPSSVRGARARPAVCSLRLGGDGSRDALAAQDDPGYTVTPLCVQLHREVVTVSTNEVIICRTEPQLDVCFTPSRFRLCDSPKLAQEKLCGGS